MNPVILIACFSPLVAIWIVMKIAVWFSAVNDERNYVRAESKKPTDLIWQTHMQTLMRRKRSMEVAQIIDDALYEYYVVERGEKVPNWRYIKDEDWWMEYLKSLGMDPRNP